MSEVKIRGWINMESESLWEHKPRTLDTVSLVLKFDFDTERLRAETAEA